MIASMYENNVLQIKTGSVMLSEKFLGLLLVRSRNIFNLYY